jgi:hypothetical protein
MERYREFVIKLSLLREGKMVQLKGKISIELQYRDSFFQNDKKHGKFKKGKSKTKTYTCPLTTDVFSRLGALNSVDHD